MNKFIKYIFILFFCSIFSTSCITSAFVRKASRDSGFYKNLKNSYSKFYEVDSQYLIPKDKKMIVYDYNSEAEEVEEMISSGFVAAGSGGVLYTEAFFKKQKGEDSINYAVNKLGSELKAWYAVIHKYLSNKHNEWSKYEVAFYYPLTEEQKRETFPGLLLKDMKTKERKETGVNSGVYVKTAFSSTPAGEAGIRRGDVIVSFAGQKVSSTKNFYDILNSIENDSKAEIIVVRNEERLALEIQITRNDANL